MSLPACPHLPAWSRFWLLGLTLALSSATAHGGDQESDLRGVTLCLDAAAVQVQVEGMSAQRVRQVQQDLSPALARTLNTALQRAGVRHERRTSCLNHTGLTRLQIGVRYLNPQNYVGFGDPAYSYTVSLKVNVGLTPSIGPVGEARASRHFASGWSDIHSESRTGQPFVPVVAGWGEEQMRDLIVIWKRDNPTLLERLGPVGLAGLGLGTGLAVVGLLVRRRRRQA